MKNAFVIVTRQHPTRDIVIEGLQCNKPKALDVVEMKGLGVVEAEDIEKNSFVCKYKYNLSYQREKREEEYKLNGEAAT